MSYNYESNTFVNSHMKDADISNSTKLFNGTMRHISNPTLPGNRLQQALHQKANVFGKVNINELTPLGGNDKKLKFSEKLKVLLKNGGSKNDKIDMNDPYAFSEIDQQYNMPVNQGLNNSDSFIKKSMPPNVVKTNNIPMQKSIMFPKSVIPKLNSVIGKEDCNSEPKNNVNSMKLAKIGVPVYKQPTQVVTNQPLFKMQPDRFKPSSPRTLKTVPAQLPFNNSPFVNKPMNKPNPNLKSLNVNINKVVTGKPLSFGLTQLKNLTGKLDKKPEAKNKNLSKGKPMVNHIQKTASLNRSGSKPKKPVVSRSNSLDTDRPFTSNVINKNAKKSLLEESLLGLKSATVNKELNRFNSSKGKTTMAANSKINYSPLPLETGTAIAATPPNSAGYSFRQDKHDSLQRIWAIRNKLKGLKRDHHHFGLTVNDIECDENSNSESLLFQNYWFSVCNDYNSLSYHDRRRDTKLSQLKVELRHKIKQLQWRYKDEYRDKMVELLVDSARKQPNLTAFLIKLDSQANRRRISSFRTKTMNLLRPVTCAYSDPETNRQCENPIVPCVKFCQQHITFSNDQLLFAACSALRNDNTACRAPVLDQASENPLCLRHRRLELMSDIPKKAVNVKPLSKTSQPRKRSRSSTGGSSRSGRSRKRKRPPPKDKRDEYNETFSASIPNNATIEFNFGKHNDDSNDSLRRRNALTEINPQVISKSDIDESQEVEVGEEVLAMAADLPLELATQATRLLEEHDFTNVLNHIPADAFNDLFTEDKEEYQPTPQETEELERALEAVDKDVKSLEKLSQTQGILDTLLDEQTIAQTLAQLPEVTANLEVPPTLVPVFYQNGFTNLNQLEQTLVDVNKSLTQTVLLNQGSDVISNHFVTNLTIPNHADVLQS